jgi:hypothetical protein
LTWVNCDEGRLWSHQLVYPPDTPDVPAPSALLNVTNEETMRTHCRYFVALAALIVFTLPQGAIAQGGFGFDLGRAWQIQEYDVDGTIWEGTWTRRGNSPVFDAQWRSSVTGGIASDVIEFRRIENGSVVLRRYQHAGTYYGRISRDGTRIVRGTATWYAPAAHWNAQIIGQGS